jgi:hypothetical protein
MKRKLDSVRNGSAGTAALGNSRPAGSLPRLPARDDSSLIMMARVNSSYLGHGRERGAGLSNR